MPTAVGPVAVIVRGEPCWGTLVRLIDGALIWHEDQHEHVNTVAAPPVVYGETLLVPTTTHGPVEVRAFEPGDTWRVWPSGLTAFEAAMAELH